MLEDVMKKYIVFLDPAYVSIISVKHLKIIN